MAGYWPGQSCLRFYGPRRSKYPAPLPPGLQQTRLVNKGFIYGQEENYLCGINAGNPELE